MFNVMFYTRKIFNYKYLILVCSHLVRGDLAVLRCTAVALVEASEALVGSQW